LQRRQGLCDHIVEILYVVLNHGSRSHVPLFGDGEATVDADDLASHEGSAVGKQKFNDFGDFVWLGEALQRMDFGPGLAVKNTGSDGVPNHWRVDVAR